MNLLKRKKCAAASAVILAAGLVIGLAVPPPAEADVTGPWDMTVRSPQGTGRVSITLKQKADKLTGVYRGRMGEAPLEGTISGDRIRFSVTLKFQDQPFSITYSGTVENDSMKGTARFGDGGTGSWSARRRKNGT